MEQRPEQGKVDKGESVMVVVGFKIDDTYYTQGFHPREFVFKTKLEMVDLIEIQIVLRPRKDKSLRLEYLGRDAQGDLYYIHPEESRFVPAEEGFVFQRRGDVYVSQVFSLDPTPAAFLEQIKTVLNKVLDDRRAL